MSIKNLIENVVKMQNPSVFGLDPKFEYVPEFIRTQSVKKFGKTLEAAADAILEFNKGLIDSLYDIVPCVKPQSAYYEMYGIPGLIALQKTIEYSKEKGLYVILDGKRNDIGATAAAYASAYLGETQVEDQKIRAFSPDALTINPYLGSDGIIPFLNECKHNEKAVFILSKTSNPSSVEFQDLMIYLSPLSIRVAQKINEWGAMSGEAYGYYNAGAVTGATFAGEMPNLRRAMPKSFLLIPGYGAQGASAQMLAPAFDKNGLGAIINSSRAIMLAFETEKCSEKDFGGAARREAIRMKDELLTLIGKEITLP